MTSIAIDVAWWVGEAIEDAETSIFAVTAGLGSGKTHGAVQWHHYLSYFINKNAQFSAFMEPTFQKIHDAAIPKFKTVLKSFGLSEGSDYRIIKSPYPKLIYTETKHEVHFLSAEAPEKIIAAEYSHATEDESGIIDKEATDNLRGRLRDTRAVRRQLFRSGAPQGITHFAEKFDSETLPGWDTSIKRDHFKRDTVEGTLIQLRRFICWTDDNPYLPADYIPTLMDTYGHNQAYIDAYRYGRFVPFNTGSAYANYTPIKHDIDNIEASPYRDIIFTWDFNAAPLAWLVIQATPYVEYGERKFSWTVIDEANQGSSNLDEAVVEFAAKFPKAIFKSTPIKLYGDRSGHAPSHKIEGSDYDFIYKTLKELGYQNVEICASRLVALETSSVDAVQRLLLNNLLKICKRARMLKKSLMATTWKPNVRKLDKPAGETWTHWSDALKYWAWQETRSYTAKGSNKVYGTSH